jgi:ABC-2 type transport system ATP-binding protein
MINNSVKTEHGTRTDEIVIEFSDVYKTFLNAKSKSRTIALKDINFKAQKGKITGLVGPDAAGKTTLMRMAAGLMLPDSGRITVLGNDACRHPLQVQSEVAYMPQRFGLYEDLTAQENLNLYADLQGVSKSQRPDHYAELMRMTNLAPFTSRLAGRLSGGMKQKLGLACTLVRYQRLLILDEPTVGVDPLSRRELWSIIYHLVKEEGVSVILSTAYLDEAEKCDDIVLMHEGRILGKGPPESFKQKAAGRTYLAVSSGIKRRTLRARLVQQENILDATIQGDNVRLVTESSSLSDIQDLFFQIPEATIKPVPARFEDSFIAILHDQKSVLEGPQHADFDTGRQQRPQSQKDVIQVDNLRRRFGDFYAVDGISFEVQQGEIFGLLGANGAGKSTTFRMLCGLLPISSGTIRVADVDLRLAPTRARLCIGYMSQKFSLYGDLSVRQNLKFFSSAYGLTGKNRAERVEWAVEQFDLGSQADINSISLPLGYKQRLAMACSLMHDPDILFLDEPTSGVDPLARRQFWNQINALAQQGVTVMVTTHFMEEAEYCDRIAIMAAGRILTLGSPAEIRKAARTDQNPEPTIEDAFIRLIKENEADRRAS